MKAKMATDSGRYSHPYPLLPAILYSDQLAPFTEILAPPLHSVIKAKKDFWLSTFVEENSLVFSW